MRRLVITADDAGRELDSTMVIAELLRDGLITATTLIPVAPDAEAALDLVGAWAPRVHATFTSERGCPAWSPLTGGASLTVAGSLPLDPDDFVTHGTSDDVAAELEAQIGWFSAHGVTPSGLDSHSGTLYGLQGRSFLGIALQASARHGLPFRLPRSAAEYWGGSLPEPLAEAHRQAVHAADALDVALPAAMITNRWSADELGSYEVLRDRLLHMLDLLPDGTSELFLHPAPETVPAPSQPIRAWELRLLQDDRFQRAIDDAFVRVATWEESDAT